MIVSEITNLIYEIEDSNMLVNSEIPLLSSIFVSINFDYLDKNYGGLYYQPTESFDYAITLNLSIYKEEKQYDEFINDLMKHKNIDLNTANEMADDFFKSLLDEYKIPDKFNEYVHDNYKLLDYNGLDANSICNELVYKINK